MATPEPSSDRLIRFGDWAYVQGVEALASISFFQGKGVRERMAVVRDAIGYVRENWRDYTKLADGLRELIEDRISDSLRVEGRERIDHVLSSPKEWRDREAVENLAEMENYSVIRLYASNFGYQQIFKIIDTIFRTSDDVGIEREALYSAVFLVELLNVDLFNYVAVTPGVNNFQGTVYRALAASEEQLGNFQELASRPVLERYWAIPLSILSASRDQGVATTYAKGEVSGQAGSSLFLWRIHVVELETELLQIYRDKFPSSVVSTICAVPIQELSGFPEHEEVVLRGPFFQLLRVQKEELEGIGEVHVMDSLMLNVNRDHPSTMELTAEEADVARNMMAHLVDMGRAKACKALAVQYGLLQDAEVYDQLYSDEAERLASIIA